MAASRTRIVPRTRGDIAPAVLVQRAIDELADGNASQLARILGHKSAGRVFAWRAETRALPPDVRALLVMMLEHPETAEWYAAAFT